MAAASRAARALKTSDSASSRESSALRRSAALPDARWSFRTRSRDSTWASADASRARSSSSLRLINGSPAKTLSLGFTSTSVTSAATTEVIFTSLDRGSTREGATAYQPPDVGRVLLDSGVTVCDQMIEAISAMIATRPRRNAILATICLIRCQLRVLVVGGTFLFLADDSAVFEINDAIRERHQTRIVRHHQHTA